VKINDTNIAGNEILLIEQLDVQLIIGNISLGAHFSSSNSFPGQ
jgi:hypothetical protein